jgi:type I restriction enzyme S subunit
VKVEWVRVSEILELQRRAVEPLSEASYREIGVRSFGKGLFIKEPVLGAELGDKRVFEVREGDFVVSNVFAWEGAVGVARPEHDRLIGSHRFMTWTPLAALNVDYLRHYFGSETGSASLANASPGSAGRNRTLSIRSFEKVDVPLPSVSSQDRIAAHLDRLAVRVEQAKPKLWTVNDELPRILCEVLRQAVPNTTTVGQLCSNRQSVIHPGDDLQGAKEFVGLEHVESHTGRRLGGRPIGDETGRKLLFEPGQVTYGYLRPYLNKAWVADRTGLCSVEQFTLTPVDGVDPRVLSVVLRSDVVWRAAQEATNSLQLPRLSLGALMSFVVPDVRGLTWDSISEKVIRVTDLAVREANLREKREVLRASVLPAARNEIFNSMR